MPLTMAVAVVSGHDDRQTPARAGLSS